MCLVILVTLSHSLFIFTFSKGNKFWENYLTECTSILSILKYNKSISDANIWRPWLLIPNTYLIFASLISKETHIHDISSLITRLITKYRRCEYYHMSHLKRDYHLNDLSFITELATRLYNTRVRLEDHDEVKTSCVPENTFLHNRWRDRWIKEEAFTVANRTLAWIKSRNNLDLHLVNEVACLWKISTIRRNLLITIRETYNNGTNEGQDAKWRNCKHESKNKTTLAFV